MAKHSQDSRGAATPFSNSLLEGTVVIAVGNINAAGVFAENLRKELSSYVYQPLSESSDEYCFLKTLYDDFTKSGNLDKYYSKYYAKVPLRSTTFFSIHSIYSGLSILSILIYPEMQLLCYPLKYLTV